MRFPDGLAVRPASKVGPLVTLASSRTSVRSSVVFTVAGALPVLVNASVYVTVSPASIAVSERGSATFSWTRPDPGMVTGMQASAGSSACSWGTQATFSRDWSPSAS